MASNTTFQNATRSNLDDNSYTSLPSFDELLAMANEQPEQLEQLRQTLINEIIDQSPAKTQARLKGLQFQIDAQRSIAKTSLAACVKLSSMMMDSFEKMRHELPAAKRIGHIHQPVQTSNTNKQTQETQMDLTDASNITGNSNVVPFRRQP